MKIRLKVSVKVRGGRIFIPGVYDSENEGFSELFNTLTGNESSDVFEALDSPVVKVENDPSDDENEGENENEGEDESEETEDEVEDEEVSEEEKPKKKGKKGKKGK